MDVQERIKKLESQRTDWNIPLETKEFLINFIKQQGCNKILEIGTYNGYSALIFSTLADQVTTIDKSPEFLPEAKESLKDLENVTLLEGDAKEILPTLHGQKFDFVFIDAMKKEYATYVTLVLPLLVEGGIIIADNTISHKERLGEFFKLLREKNLTHRELAIGDGLVVISP